MDRHDVDRLLADARLVLDYAARSGKLENDKLLVAVTDVEAARAAGGEPSTDQISALYIALNEAVTRIVPMTLQELRAGRSPFSDRTQRSIRVSQIWLCLSTILITVLVAFYTLQLHQDQNALVAYQQITDSHASDRLFALRKLVQIEGALKKQDSYFDRFHHDLVEMKDLNARLSSAYLLIREAAIAKPFPFYFKPGFVENQRPEEAKAANKPSRSLWDFLSGPAKVVENPSPPKDDGSQKNEVSKDKKNQNSDLSNSKATDDCIRDNTKSDDDDPSWLSAMRLDSANEFCFLQRINLGYNPFEFPNVAFFAAAIQNRMATINGWVLPLLYGLLGAVVFLLRNMLSGQGTFFDIYSAVIRVGAGGVAGIIIGWFSVPATLSTAIVAPATLPYIVAFLAGFSIDIVFSLLDRLIKTISEVQGKSDGRGKIPTQHDRDRESDY